MDQSMQKIKIATILPECDAIIYMIRSVLNANFVYYHKCYFISLFGRHFDGRYIHISI